MVCVVSKKNFKTISFVGKSVSQLATGENSTFALKFGTHCDIKQKIPASMAIIFLFISQFNDSVVYEMKTEFFYSFVTVSSALGAICCSSQQERELRRIVSRKQLLLIGTFKRCRS